MSVRSGLLLALWPHYSEHTPHTWMYTSYDVHTQLHHLSGGKPSSPMSSIVHCSYLLAGCATCSSPSMVCGIRRGGVTNNARLGMSQARGYSLEGC